MRVSRRQLAVILDEANARPGTQVRLYQRTWGKRVTVVFGDGSPSATSSAERIHLSESGRRVTGDFSAKDEREVLRDAGARDRGVRVERAS